MPVRLLSPISEFVLNYPAWDRVLCLAEDFGWEPKGCKLPQGIEIEDFDPLNYHFPGAQIVSLEDTRGLIAAISIALDDIPNEDVAPLENPDKLNNLEFFSGEAGKRTLRQFIGFCRAGSFKIF